MPKMIVRWPGLHAKVSVQLAADLNADLVREVWGNLPFTCVQDHGVVTGKIMYCWVPLVSIAPVERLDKHTEAPIGRVSYSQGTGNKIIIKYGECTEDIGAPVLGIVAKEDLATLDQVGKQAWESSYLTKDLIEVVFEKGGE